MLACDELRTCDNNVAIVARAVARGDGEPSCGLRYVGDGDGGSDERLTVTVTLSRRLPERPTFGSIVFDHEM